MFVKREYCRSYLAYSDTIYNFEKTDETFDESKLQSCLNRCTASDSCFSFQFTANQNKCVTKNLAILGPELRNKAGTIYYVKVYEEGCNHFRTFKNHVFDNRCLLEKSFNETRENCLLKCEEKENCFSVNYSKQKSCHLLCGIGNGASIVSYKNFETHIKPLCLATFQVELQWNSMSVNEKPFPLIQNYGDGMKTCSLGSIDQPTVIFTTTQYFRKPVKFDVQVFLNALTGPCTSIVDVGTYNNEIYKSCQLLEQVSNICKFSCSVSNLSKFLVKPLVKICKLYQGYKHELPGLSHFELYLGKTMEECLKLCEDHVRCASFTWNSTSKKCGLLKYAFYDNGMSFAADIYYYSKIIHSECSNWKRFQKVVIGCICLIDNIKDIQSEEECVNICNRTDYCLGVNVNLEERSCHTLSADGPSASYFEIIPAVHYSRPQCLGSTFNIELEWHDFISTNSYKSLLKSLGDGETKCQTDMIYNSNVIFTSEILFEAITIINVNIYLSLLNKTCDNVVKVTANFYDEFEPCYSIEGNEYYCSFSCVGSNYNKIRLEPIMKDVKICEVSLTSTNRLISVCV
ncbi:DgyrCDS13239 [Dimorphilus gyrociliatus]|uniref:DgyrCDS13239 n=1 Tax=Dimorphilus gyrociliatus TaxID=2664684 RepID=A0A7I8WA50_9ANNE|nr:DgyrCDS13239 [Dimorphilus gyrociliatus]